ncbi:MAG TPA: DinB family protein [Terriglobales bacterium]|nr:DinB family protein [Terriglobales bacterium]
MHSKLARLQQVLSDAIHGMTPEELTLHPQGKWSAAEILEHLNLTYIGTIKNLDRCLAAGKSGASSDRSKRRWARLLITHLGFFPSARESPERVRPRGTPPDQVKTEVMGNIARMDEVISRCESEFAPRRPIADHPVLGPLTAAEWRGFHITHGKHHARQIIRLRSSREIIQ